MLADGGASVTLVSGRVHRLGVESTVAPFDRGSERSTYRRMQDLFHRECGNRAVVGRALGLGQRSLGPLFPPPVPPRGWGRRAALRRGMSVYVVLWWLLHP
jgi:hypothetical protein